MDNDLLCEYEKYANVRAMWLTLKDNFGVTSATKLRRLTIKFDTYKKRPQTTMRQHLREMANLIRDLTNAGHILSDEQQVQAVIRSLPRSWEHMKINMTHNDNIQTFVDISRHLELEDERLQAANPKDLRMKHTLLNMMLGLTSPSIVVQGDFRKRGQSLARNRLILLRRI